MLRQARSGEDVKYSIVHKQDGFTDNHPEIDIVKRREERVAAINIGSYPDKDDMEFNPFAR